MPGASQASAWPTKHGLLTTNYEPKSPSRRASDQSDEKIVIVRGALKPIDKAVAFLRRELAHGEVEAALVEENAKTDGIAPRTLDRARARLRVISRRSGFAKNGRSWLSLTTTPGSP